MVISAIKTMTQKVLWKDRDVIIIDMPPGTGDTQLTFAQEVKVDGAIIVSTPQDLALLDVKRGIQMFDKTGVKILGLIDNMSHFVGDDKKKYPIFRMVLEQIYPAMPIDIIPTTICSNEPPMYEFQIKKPRPPPPWVPPPEIISAARTTSQVIPIPTAAPVNIDGKVPGSTIFQNKSI